MFDTLWDKAILQVMPSRLTRKVNHKITLKEVLFDTLMDNAMKTKALIKIESCIQPCETILARLGINE